MRSSERGDVMIPLGPSGAGRVNSPEACRAELGQY